MKKIVCPLVVILGVAMGFSQNNVTNSYTGDNFSLEGALDMFKKVNSLEEFEMAINQENNNVNNLDLNNDGDIDYITIRDIQDRDTHVIVLSTYLNETEKQDIATIGIERNGESQATLQIEGDENLYGTNTIVEPFEESNDLRNGKGGLDNSDIYTNQIAVNVWFWPCIQFVYAPRYVAWVSPHYWGFYPRWWRPWRPYNYSIFYSRCSAHRMYFRNTNTRRVIVARRVYVPNRHFSTMIAYPHREQNQVRNNDRNYRENNGRRRNERKENTRKNNKVRGNRGRR